MADNCKILYLSAAPVDGAQAHNHVVWCSQAALDITDYFDRDGYEWLFDKDWPDDDEGLWLWEGYVVPAHDLHSSNRYEGGWRRLTLAELCFFSTWGHLDYPPGAVVYAEHALCLPGGDAPLFPTEE